MTAKHANANLDALDRRVLEQQLPGISASLDRKAMRDHLQTALIGPGRPTRVQHCGVTSAILLDSDCVLVRYELGIQDGDGEVGYALVTGRVYPDADRAAAYEAERLTPLVLQVCGREEVEQFATPVAVIERLGMVVHAFPIDAELPTLAIATDPAVAAGALAELLDVGGRAGIEVEGCRVEPVHYNRRHRCMLRYRLDLGNGRDVVLYGKVSNDGSGARVPAVVKALSVVFAGTGVTLPECLGFLEDLGVVVFAEIPGAPVARIVKDYCQSEPSTGEARAAEAVEMCGFIAAALHGSGLRLGALRPLAAELNRLRANLAPMNGLAPGLAETLGLGLDRVESRAGGTPALDLCQSHGDFSYTQILFDEDRAGLVDFDSFCQAEPALDLGQFLAYLRYAGMKAPAASAAERAGRIEFLASRFAAAYTAAGGSTQALERAAVYEAVSLIRMAEHAWLNLKGRRLHHIVGLLGELLPLAG